MRLDVRLASMFVFSFYLWTVRHCSRLVCTVRRARGCLLSVRLGLRRISVSCHSRSTSVLLVIAPLLIQIACNYSPVNRTSNRRLMCLCFLFVVLSHASQPPVLYLRAMLTFLTACATAKSLATALPEGVWRCCSLLPLAHKRQVHNHSLRFEKLHRNVSD